jgi:aminoglycoside 6-adenylyltransferase
MQPTLLLREQCLDRIVAWGRAHPAVLALALVGSGARTQLPADPWSDIDLILVAAGPESFLDSAEWLAEIGEPWVSTVERGPDGAIVERRVLYRSGVDVDFLLLGADQLDRLRQEPLCAITARGFRPLLDPAGVFAPFLPAPQSAAPEPGLFPPAAEQFAELVDDFWLHCIWTAKKLRRGELWTAKSCCDGYMKRHLLTMIEWQARARGGAALDPWYNGRFLERWADPAVLARLPGVFAHYDAAEVWQALGGSMALFDDLAREAARCFGYPYPAQMAQSLRTWTAELSNGVLGGAAAETPADIPAA